MGALVNRFGITAPHGKVMVDLSRSVFDPIVELEHKVL